MMFFVSMRSRGDLAMDAISIAALIVVGLAMMAALAFLMKPESK
jgi:hypothetical protein